jgi:RHS repeat-associated protein
LFNGIERVEELEINIDMAVFRSYDPAIGRWWQVDPLASLSFDWTTYRFGLNNPVVYSDPFGLFETRKEARKYAKDHGIKLGLFGSFSISKNKNEDGKTSYSIDENDGSKSITKDQELGIIESDIKVTANKIGVIDQVTEGFWELMRSGDRWAQGEGGQKYAQHIADLNPLVSGVNAYYGYTKGENIYGQRIGQDQSTLYAIGAVPPMKIAAGLKVLGGTTLLSGIIPVSKKAFNLPVGLGGSKNALLSTVIAYKLGFRGSLGRKVPTFIGPSASSLETAIGRNAIPIGGSMIGAGYLLENTGNK